ncbi:hypothetical protein LTS18_012852, partial [Coniosporium uncinatum]
MTASDSERHSQDRPRSNRASGALAKQPSIVREDAEQEAIAEKANSANTSRKVNVLPVTTSKDHTRTSSMTTATPLPRSYQTPNTRTRALSLDDPTKGRAASISPARSAHFSNRPVDILNGIKHIPPPRSLSPAKSALKHSPSSSIRTSSPVANFATGRRDKRMSVDGSEVGSEDGYQATRRKKSVRIDDDDLDKAADLSATKQAARPAFADMDENQFSQPRPALPSFGSVRGRKPSAEEQRPETVVKVTETVSSSMSNSTSSDMGQGASSDHGAGGVLARDFADKQSRAQQHE